MLAAPLQWGGGLGLPPHLNEVAEQSMNYNTPLTGLDGLTDMPNLMTWLVMSNPITYTIVLTILQIALVANKYLTLYYFKGV